MKPEKYILRTEADRNEVLKRLLELPCDGKLTVSLSDAGSKSSRQRGLDWRWNTDIANSGMGGKFEDSKDNVHRVCKYKWAIPIMIRDNPFFAELYAAYIALHKNDADRMKWFVDNMVHTESFDSHQMSEYMTEKQRHYVGHGFTLTDPEDLLTAGN